MRSGPPRSADVRALYERFPYPMRRSDAEPIYDVAMGLDLVLADPAGLEVLDAGCGTGHRLVGLASQYPDTRFLGLDFSAHSLAVARELARHHGCDNVEFLHAEIGGPPIGRRFDLVTSTGVLHHLEDPAAGARWLQRHLKPEGIAYTWYYHPYGEFDRLRARELVHLLLRHAEQDLSDTILADLGLALSVRQYGTRTSFSDDSDATRLAADADAYLHPIVHAYRFQEAAELLRPGSDWAVVHGVNWDGGSGVIDSTDWSGTEFGTVSTADLFPNARPRAAFDRMDAAARLLCVELRLRPTGFTLVSGSAAGLDRCTDRLRRNAERADLLHPPAVRKATP